MEKRLAGTNKAVEDFIKDLEELEITNRGCTIAYLDSATGKKYLKYLVDQDNGRFFNLLQINPPLSTQDLIGIALESPYPDEVFAASTRLYFEELEFHREYRDWLLNLLNEKVNTKLSIDEKKRIKNIIEGSRLLNKMNLRNIVGKHYTEVNADNDFFKKIADKASEILLKIEA